MWSKIYALCIRFLRYTGRNFLFTAPKIIGSNKQRKSISKYRNILAEIYRTAMTVHRIELGAEQFQGRSFSFYE